MSEAASAALVEARDLTRFYDARRGVFGGTAVVRALAGVSFTLETRKTLAVVGESGCGKSTLARLVTMIETPTSGELKIGGVDVKLASAASARRSGARSRSCSRTRSVRSIRARPSARRWRNPCWSTPPCVPPTGARPHWR